MNLYKTDSKLEAAMHDQYFNHTVQLILKYYYTNTEVVKARAGVQAALCKEKVSLSFACMLYWSLAKI